MVPAAARAPQRPKGESPRAYAVTGWSVARVGHSTINLEPAPIATARSPFSLAAMVAESAWATSTDKKVKNHAAITRLPRILRCDEEGEIVVGSVTRCDAAAVIHTHTHARKSMPVPGIPRSSAASQKKNRKHVSGASVFVRVPL